MGTSTTSDEQALAIMGTEVANLLMDTAYATPTSAIGAVLWAAHKLGYIQSAVESIPALRERLLEVRGLHAPVSEDEGLARCASCAVVAPCSTRRELDYIVDTLPPRAPILGTDSHGRQARRSVGQDLRPHSPWSRDES